MNQTRGITMKYASEFKCIGADCPDSCCHSWNVVIDRQTYERMKKILPKTEINEKTKIVSKKDHNYASIRMDNEGWCPFLDKNDMMCGMQKKYGEECLSITCKVYPRQVSFIYGRVEMGLTLSCPEAARKCLLECDSTVLEGFNAEEIIAKGVSYCHYTPERVADPYFKYVDVIRDAVLSLLSIRDFDIGARIFVASYFLSKISKFIYKGVKSIDESNLAKEFDSISAEGMIFELCREFNSINISGEFSVSLIQDILITRLTNYPGSNNYLALDQEALNTYGVESVVTRESIEFKRTDGCSGAIFENINKGYCSRRDTLIDRYGNGFNQYFENYCRNYWFKDIFVNSQTPFEHMQEMVLRLAVVKFLLISNPIIEELLQNEIKEGGKKILDDAAVGIFYKFSRSIEHAPEILDSVKKKMKDQNMESLAHMVHLMKF